MWETLEQRNGITLPAWLRKILQVLTDFGPDLPRLARFDRFEHWSPYEEGIKAMWFQMAIGDPDDEQRIVMEKSALFPIAEEVNLTLAINLADPDDRRIYEYHREDISYSAGLTDSPQVVFDSYLNMLDHIAAIKVGGEIIEPQTGTT